MRALPSFIDHNNYLGSGLRLAGARKPSLVFHHNCRREWLVQTRRGLRRAAWKDRKEKGIRVNLITKILVIKTISNNEEFH